MCFTCTLRLAAALHVQTRAGPLRLVPLLLKGRKNEADIAEASVLSSSDSVHWTNEQESKAVRPCDDYGGIHQVPSQNSKWMGVCK